MATVTTRYSMPRPEPTDSFKNWDAQVAETYQILDKYYGLRIEDDLPVGVCEGDAYIDADTYLVIRQFGVNRYGIGSASTASVGLSEYDWWDTRATVTGTTEAPIAVTPKFRVYPNYIYRISFSADVRWSTSRAGYFGTRIRTQFGSGDIGPGSPELRTFRHYIDNTGNGSSPVGGSTLMFYIDDEATDCQIALSGQAEGSNNWVMSDNRKTNTSARGESWIIVHNVGQF